MASVVQQNRIGHLHIWHNASSEPVRISKYNYHLDGRESDEYLQVDYDIVDFMAMLSADDRDSLDNGYHVTLTTGGL